jgi:enamine deaminase RidA (YjgF/YER057c/UK114 family)
MKATSTEPLLPGTSLVEQRLIAAGLWLPEVRAQGAYAVASLHGDTIWTAGQLSRTAEGVLTGLARGPDDLLAAKHACEIAVLRAIAAVRTLVDLDRVKQVLYLRGFIAAAPSFEQHTQALDAASAILHLAFGAAVGNHARSALGVSSLPAGGLAELELTVVIG